MIAASPRPAIIKGLSGITKELKHIMTRLNAIPGSIGLAATLLLAGNAYAAALTGAGAALTPIHKKRTNAATAGEVPKFNAWAY